MSRLDEIRARAVIYSSDSDMTYLLNLVDLLEKQIQAQILTQLDPSNETEYLRCWCIDEIIDDAGSTLISSPTPGCPVHGKKPGP